MCVLLTCPGSLKSELLLGDFCVDGCACRWLQVTVAASLEWEWYGCCSGSPLSSHLVQGITLPACMWLHTSTAVMAGNRKQEATVGGQMKRKGKGPVSSLNTVRQFYPRKAWNELGREAPFGTLLRIKVLMLWPHLAVWVPCTHQSHTLTTWGCCSTGYYLLQEVLQVLRSPWMVRCLSCCMYNSFSLPYIRGEKILVIVFCC